ncbi:ring finger protein-like [Anolis sagrei]|uniref:ring finger protein-like n=1 Tax=Anolis sagrei TaxID=38937 RepID=UPI0035205702
MGTDPLDSESRGLGTDPALSPSLEEMEAAGPRATCLWGQEVKSEGKMPRSRARTKALSEAEKVVLTVSCLPGSRWEEADYIEVEEGEEKGEVLDPNREAVEREPLLGLSPSAASAPLDPPGQGGYRWEEVEAEEGEEKEEVLGPNRGAAERDPLLGLSPSAASAPLDPPGQGGSRWEEAEKGEEEGEDKTHQGAAKREPLLGLSPSAASAPPDLEGPLPSSANILESIEEAGHGLPLGGSTGAEPPVDTLKDAVLHRQTENVNIEEETTKEETEEEEEVGLELCCIQVEEPLEEVECPICMEAEQSEGEEKEITEEEVKEEEEQMVVEELGEDGATMALESCCLIMEESPEEPECPICTEPYDQEAHRPAPLNCSHVLCGRCLQAIMEAGSAADIGRVRCPICRQKTPMMEWEICRLQEELLLLGASEDPTEEIPVAASLLFHPLPPRRPGFWGGLEHRFRVRFLTSRTVGCLPCLRYPPGLVQRLERLERRCQWGYRLALLALTAADALSLLLVFLPIALLLLLFLIMDQ